MGFAGSGGGGGGGGTGYEVLDSGTTYYNVDSWRYIQTDSSRTDIWPDYLITLGDPVGVGEDVALRVDDNTSIDDYFQSSVYWNKPGDNWAIAIYPSGLSGDDLEWQLIGYPK